MVPIVIRIHKNDNVVTAKSDIDINTDINEEKVNTNQHIPVGHKIATKDISKGNEIIKYDTIIGIAKEDIKIGDHVHVHNTGMSDKKKDYEFSQGCKNDEILPESQRATFMGYHRPNGKVGTRNFIGIISSLNLFSLIAFIAFFCEFNAKLS